MKAVVGLFSLIRGGVWFAGLILCMCEAADMGQQCRNMVIGLAMIIIASLPSLIRSGYEYTHPDDMEVDDDE